MSQRNEKDAGETLWHRSSNVAYWRFFVNIALIACDMASYILASVVVLMMRDEVALYSSRFGFHIGLPWYVLACAVIWVLCLHSVGVYHRHVMGDGYQLNLLLFKGAVFAGIMVCAMDFILNAYLSLLSTVLCMICAMLLTMIVRFIIRRVVLFSREKGEYSYATVVVGSAEGIEHALQFLSQKRQLNYRPIAVCPIALDAATGHITGADAPEEFTWHVREICGKDISVLPYNSDFAERAVARGAQTVMVTDVMQRFSDNFNTFVLDAESMNLEIAVVTSAVDASGHETRIRVLQGTTVMTICLPQYSPAAMLQKRIFDIVVSLLALVGTAIITIPVAIAIKLTDGGSVLYTQTRVGRRGRPFKMIKFRSMVMNADKMKAKLMKTIAEEQPMVFCTSTDYYTYRIGRSKSGVYEGVVIRDGEILYDVPAPIKKRYSFPTFETLALYNDGRVESWHSKEKSAEEYIRDGACQVYTFGPCLVRDGAFTEFITEIANRVLNPRHAFGMVEPGHYIDVICEGRLKSTNGSTGVAMEDLAQIMIDRGCTLAVNLDGGQTAVMCFMGKQLNMVQVSEPYGRTTKEVLSFGKRNQ